MACAILALVLATERFLSLSVQKVAPPKLTDEAISVSRSGLPSTEIILQLEQNSLLGRVLAKGFQSLSHNPRLTEGDLRAILENEGREAAHELKRYLAALATLAAAAPLLGLLGTVIDIIVMIEVFGAQGASSGAASEAGNPMQMAQGASAALYSTAFGLMVAVFTLLVWRYFCDRVDGHLLRIELATERFARHLNTLRKVS